MVELPPGQVMVGLVLFEGGRTGDVASADRIGSIMSGRSGNRASQVLADRAAPLGWIVERCCSAPRRVQVVDANRRQLRPTVTSRGVQF